MIHSELNNSIERRISGSKNAVESIGLSDRSRKAIK